MGDRGAARNTYDQAVTWMDRHKPADAELVRFRQEAAALMSQR
jgi:hypothetical protein